jgi:hypothetical protein
MRNSYRKEIKYKMVHKTGEFMLRKLNFCHKKSHFSSKKLFSKLKQNLPKKSKTEKLW